MGDRVTPQQRSENMRRIRSKGMKPEMTVRRLSHALGYRHRLHRKELPGKPDLVYPGRRKAVFVHGCFWHQHPDRGCKIARRPKSNLGYWGPKLDRNVERDARVQAELREKGWECMIVWECEAREAEAKGSDALASKIRRFLG